MLMQALATRNISNQSNARKIFPLDKNVYQLFTLRKIIPVVKNKFKVSNTDIRINEKISREFPTKFHVKISYNTSLIRTTSTDTFDVN